MESLEFLLGTGLVGLLLNAITGLGKWAGFESETSLALASLLLGLIYASFKIFTPVELQQSVYEFVLQMMGAANIIYLYIIKPVKK